MAQQRILDEIKSKLLDTFLRDETEFEEPFREILDRLFLRSNHPKRREGEAVLARMQDRMQDCRFRMDLSEYRKVPRPVDPGT